MKKFLIGIISTLVLSTLANASEIKEIGGIKAKSIVIRVNNVVNDNAPKSLAALEFKKNMESKFPGRVSVKIFNNSSLFKDGEEMEALDIGAIDVIIPASGKISDSYGVKEFDLFDLPFLFNKPEDITKFIQSSSSDKLLGLFNKQQKNLYAVAFWPNDFRNYISSKPLKTPNDFKGLTARVENNGTMKMYYDTLGVKNTINIPFASLSNAMKKVGEYQVDVSANPNSNALSAKLYDSAKFLTLSKHDVSSYVFLTNRRWFNNLPEDIKIGFVDAAKVSGLANFEFAQKQSNSDLESLKKNGVSVYTWTKDEKDSFKSKAVLIHENYLKNINQTFLNEVYNIVK